ncbi:hypothetical protein J6590_068603 [Homalodisca vitripennis]|nr:hypothetical protein J6590_068603 [Homalodisca vitripennis]
MKNFQNSQALLYIKYTRQLQDQLSCSTRILHVKKSRRNPEMTNLKVIPRPNGAKWVQETLMYLGRSLQSIIANYLGYYPVVIAFRQRGNDRLVRSDSLGFYGANYLTPHKKYSKDESFQPFNPPMINIQADPRSRVRRQSLTLLTHRAGAPEDARCQRVSPGDLAVLVLMSSSRPTPLLVSAAAADGLRTGSYLAGHRSPPRDRHLPAALFPCLVFGLFTSRLRTPTPARGRGGRCRSLHLAGQCWNVTVVGEHDGQDGLEIPNKNNRPSTMS